jgi:hypothetical protein
MKIFKKKEKEKNIFFKHKKNICVYDIFYI